MNLDDLNLQNKLVNIITGKIVGYTLVSNTGRVVALTKSKILELDMDLANYIDYTDVPILEVYSYNNTYALSENRLYFIDEYEESPYKVLEDNKVCIYGNVINKYHLITLDSDTVIKSIINGDEV